MSKFTKMETSFETLKEIETYPCLAIPERNISKQTAERFGVRSQGSSQTGEVIAHFFPYTRKGKIVGYKKRDLLKPKKSAFSIIGEVNEGCDLFGQNVAETGAYKVFIFEGEYDCLAAYEALLTNQKSEYKKLPNCVSLGLGAVGSDVQFLSQKEGFLDTFKQRVLALDNDEAGKEGTQRLVFHDASLLVVNLSQKDPCEVIEQEGSQSLFRQLAYEAKAYQPDDVITEILPHEELFTATPPGVTLPFLPKLSYMLDGLRAGSGAGELTTVLAPSGVGKSTLCREIGLTLLEQGKSVDMAFIEEEAKKTQQALVALINQVPLPQFRKNPNIVPLKKQEKTREWLTSKVSQWVNKEATFGKLQGSNLIQRVKWASAKGIEYVIIDHLTMVLYGNGGVGDIDELMRDLAAVVNVTGVHVILVSHITRKNRPAPREKDGSVKYPYWVEVHKEDARGAGSIEQCSWNIICLEPEVINSNNDRGRVRIRVEKNREWGNVGMADMYRLNPTTGRIQTVSNTEVE